MQNNQQKIVYIKNMVCNRCVKAVKEEFQKLGIPVKNISMGEVEIYDTLNEATLTKLEKKLLENGFELIKDKRAKIIEKIKNLVIDTIYNDEEFLSSQKKFSGLIEKQIGTDYHYLSTLYSSFEGITIEQYVILQKVERVKELLKYGELTLSEIAYKLGYSSVQHLSNQFKKVTGLSASEFKKLTTNTRLPLDKVSS